MMNVRLAPVPANPDCTMYETLARSFRKLIEETRDVFVLDADLGINRILTDDFIQKHPGRYINAGIAEANMLGIACGMSAHGKRPFVHTFACLMSRRALDQVFLSGSFNRSSVKMIATFPGIAAEINGGTHMAFEDIAVMRAIPEMTVLEPCDAVQGGDLLRQAADLPGMVYIRWERGGNKRYYEQGSEFAIGKAVRLREGGDVTILAAGSICMEQSLLAADRLAVEKIEARILDIFSLKPFDVRALRDAIDETGALVTVENHNIINGLGACVASEMAQYRFAPLEMVGIRDEFGEVGTVRDLRLRFGLTADAIAAAAKRALSRKISPKG